MKKLLTVLLAALCALLLCAPVLAEATRLMTTVPSEHTVTIVCGENGSVVIEGQTCDGTFSVWVPRLGTLKLTVKPDNGYALSQIAASDLAGLSISGNTASLSGVHRENTLTIAFQPLEQEPEDMDCGSTEGGATTETGAFPPMGEVKESILGRPTLADATVIPWLTKTGNSLYDDLLGTGSGMGQLHIVFDGAYLPEDYTLLNILMDDETRENCVMVCAYPDENGQAARRSLILSAAQLVKLAQTQGTASLLFENGEVTVSVKLAELLGGDVQKLVAAILTGADIPQDASQMDLGGAVPAAIPIAELAAVKAEVRVVPPAEGSEMGYEVSAWLRWGDEQITEITAMLETLETYRITSEEDASEDVVQIPGMLPEHQKDEAMRFMVNVSQDGGLPVVTVDMAAALAPYRRHALRVFDLLRKN